MPPPETHKSEIGSQPTMCQVHTGGAYISLLAPGKTDYYTACHPRRLPRTITTHNTHDILRTYVRLLSMCCW